MIASILMNLCSKKKCSSNSTNSALDLFVAQKWVLVYDVYIYTLSWVYIQNDENININLEEWKYKQNKSQDF